MKSASTLRTGANLALILLTATASTVAQEGSRDPGEAEASRGRRPGAATSVTNRREPFSLAHRGALRVRGGRKRDSPRSRGSAQSRVEADRPDPLPPLHELRRLGRPPLSLRLRDEDAPMPQRSLGDRPRHERQLLPRWLADRLHGRPPGQRRGDAWDVYLGKVDGEAKPINLTEGLGTRDEDPRFAPDGKRIVFKQDGELRIMDLATRRLRSIPFGGARPSGRCRCSPRTGHT